jgi:hypothetical protein
MMRGVVLFAGCSSQWLELVVAQEQLRREAYVEQAIAPGWDGMRLWSRWLLSSTMRREQNVLCEARMIAMS